MTVVTKRRAGAHGVQVGSDARNRCAVRNLTASEQEVDPKDWGRVSKPPGTRAAPQWRQA